MAPFFSILIPVYNQVGKMDRCVESLHEQSFRDFEAICVDDGSTDASFDMLLAYQKADERFKVIRHKTNSSLVTARYSGMKAAQGQYVLFVDSDDYVEADMLQSLHRELTENPADILRFGYFMEPDRGIRLPVEADDSLKAFLEGKEPAALWKRAYSVKVIKKALDAITPFYCNMGEDTFFSCVFFSLAKSFSKLDRPFYHYETGGMSSLGVTVSKEKMKRDLESASASAANTISFMEGYNPAYLDSARKATRAISRYIVWTAINAEPDLARIVEMLQEIPRDEDDDLFYFSCRKLLLYKAEKLLTNNARSKTLEEFLVFFEEEA